MEKSQTSLLLNLAKKLKKRQRSKEAIILSLHSAGILTKEGEVTDFYPQLKRAISNKIDV